MPGQVTAFEYDISYRGRSGTVTFFVISGNRPNPQITLDVSDPFIQEWASAAPLNLVDVVREMIQVVQQDFARKDEREREQYRQRLEAGTGIASRAVRPQAGYVYLIKAGEFYKIGRTSQMSRRVADLGIQVPYPVALIHSIPCADMRSAERNLHDQCRDFRRHGEWFDLPQEWVDWIRSIQSL